MFKIKMTNTNKPINGIEERIKNIYTANICNGMEYLITDLLTLYEDSVNEALAKRDKVILIEDLTNLGKDEMYCDFFRCSECEDTNITQWSNFCPNCGVKIIKQKLGDKT